MEKFLKIYVTNTDETAGYRYVNLSGIISVVQASTTTVTVTYNNNPAATDVMTITHDAIAANAHTMRDWFTDSMEVALAQNWQTSAVEAISPLPYVAAGAPTRVTVTAIGIA
jgi:hypothetical protein